MITTWIKNKYESTPNIKLWFLGVGIVAVILYLIWANYGHKAPTPTDGFKPGSPAVSAKKKNGPVLAPPIKVLPKEDVLDDFPQALIAPQEEFVDSVDIEDAPDGATVLTKIDTSTGEVTNIVEIKPSPWFALRRANTVEVYGMASSEGNRVNIDLTRDVFSIKDATIAVKAGATIPIGTTDTNRSEGHIGIGVKYKFDWM